MKEYPYGVVTGQGLGVSYSSLTQTGVTAPMKEYGQAKINLFLNISTGNLVVQDYAAKLIEANCPVEFQYTYNSLGREVNAGWHFSNKKFTGLNPKATAIVLQEMDGHLTTYTLDPENPNFYNAPGHGDGTPFVRFDQDMNFWIWRDAKTNITEYYDTTGLLTNKFDARGLETKYEYDNNNNLKSIVGPSGYRYDMVRALDQDGTRFIAVMEENKQILSYTFDKRGRLSSTQISNNNGYSINYGYLTDETTLLNTITQSDGSALQCSYDMSNRVDLIQFGDGINIGSCSVRYAIDGNSSVSRLLDGNGSETTVTFDPAQNNCLLETKRQTGFEQAFSEIDITTYEYFSAGQLKTIIKPNLGKETFQYNTLFGQLINHVKPEGQAEQKIYYQDNEVSRLACDIRYIDENQTQPAVTRYVYDNTGNKSFLRFTLTPEGRVTEYRYDDRGNINTQREYLQSFCALINGMSIKMAPGLIGMVQWASEQPPENVKLTGYLYNRRGLVARKNCYVNVDNNGNGIADDVMGVEHYAWDDFGNCTGTQVKQSGSVNNPVTAITNQRYDSIHRLLYHRNALNEQTSYKYSQKKILKTCPNGRQETTEFSSRDGVVAKIREASSITGENQTRESTVLRDNNNLPVVITRPDNRLLFQFYDKQNRLGFTVDPAGVDILNSQNTQGTVIQYDYDRINRYHTQTQYAGVVNVSDFYMAGVCPVASDLISSINEIKNPLQDRVSYSFYDLSSRLLYKIDSGLYITHYLYDELNRKTGKIIYANKISQDNLNTLKSGGKINLDPDFTQDRCTRYFYDKDSNKIGSQDPAGYVIQNIYNVAGLVSQKIIYHNPASINLSQDFNEIITGLASPKDALTQYFYNPRGQLIKEINPENYETVHEYLSNGLKSTSTCEGRVTAYQYDLLNQLILTDEPFNKQTDITYNNMGNITGKTNSNTAAPKNLAPDFTRSTQSQYDGWSQNARNANPYVGQLLLNAKTPEEQAQIWANQSTRTDFEPTGLKTCVTDPLGNKTYFYYDNNRQPVVTIDARGTVVEQTRNNFGEVHVSRVYTNFIPVTNLTGGFLTSDFQTTLIHLRSGTDQITQYEHNFRGEVVEKIDPMGNRTTYQHNAFSEVSQEVLPVNSSSPTLMITHDYEPRGLETLMLKTDGKIVIAQSHEYNNPLGKETSYTDPVGGIYETLHNKLGLVTQKISNGITRESYTHNAFGQITSETDAENNMTKHQYGEDNHTHTIIFPEAGVTQKINLNIFNEKIKSTNGLDNSEFWQHDAGGKTAVYTDQLNNTTQTQNDLIGQEISQIAPNQCKTNISYDNSGYVKQKITDVDGLALEESYIRDSSGNAKSMIDARDVLTKNSFNKLNQRTETIMDTGGLNLTQNLAYNTQGTVKSIKKGDSNNPLQSVQTHQIDDFNRLNYKYIDPQGLNIRTQQELNNANQVIAEVDANGNITRTFYNSLGQKRFKVDARGGVWEWNYDANGWVSYQRVYETGINANSLNNNTSMIDLESKLKINPEDDVLYYFYDTNGREVYRVNSLGAVSEKGYNLVSSITSTVLYSNTIDAALLPNLTTEKLAELIKTSPLDRTTQYQVDAKGQPILITDPLGYTTKQIFNSMGKVITKIQYAHKDQASDPCDRMTYYIYDKLERKIFTVDPVGGVTKQEYDENNNPTQTCQFCIPIVVPLNTNYEQLVTELQKLIPDPQEDSITLKTYDKANRVISITDALGNTDIFKKNALGDTEIHIDREGNAWGYSYDAAQRLTLETAPKTMVTDVNSITENTTGKMVLSSTQKQLAVQTQTVYDKASNKVQIIAGANSTAPRNLYCGYDADNQLNLTTVNNVPIDDPSANASFITPPVKRVTLTTRTVFNIKKLKVVEFDDGGNPTFHVYNSEGKEVYTVNPKGAVIEKSYNAFGEVMAEFKYSTFLKLDLTNYFQTGIPLSVVKQAIMPDSNHDRPMLYARDNRGNIEQSTAGLVLYYLSNGDSPEYREDYPQTIYTYDAFKQKKSMSVYKGTLQGQQIWSETLYWKDGKNRDIAQYSPNGKVQIWGYQHPFQKYSSLIEWANNPSTVPTVSTAYQTLIQYYMPDVKRDRLFAVKYDLLNQKILETQKNIVVQKLMLDPKTNVPSLVDEPAQDLSIGTLYNKVGKQNGTIDTNGSAAYIYYDACQHKIAQTGVPRTSELEKILTPLTYYGIDAFGKQVSSTVFSNGTIVTSPNVLPLPIATDKEDQTSLKLLDNRSIPQFLQNAAGVTNGFTYTPTRKAARRYNPLTNYNEPMHIDERRYEFDSVDKPIFERQYRDGLLLLTTESFYNAFGDTEKETSGEPNATEGIYRKFDRTGKIWSMNALEAMKTLTLCDLAGGVSLKAVSMTQNLEVVKYSDIPVLLNTLTENDLERLETKRDLAGRAVEKIAPTYSIPDPNQPLNIPLSMDVGENYEKLGKVSISWSHPHVTTVVPKFTLWPTADNTQKQVLAITALDNRLGVDVSALPTDVYSIEIDYYLVDSDGKASDELQYRTAGVIQCNTNVIGASLSLVVNIQDDNQLILTGNTVNITDVNLYQDNKFISEIDVKKNTQSELYVDLSVYPSGSYTVQPIVTGKINLAQSLQFTVYTSILSSQPLSREIDSEFNFKILDNHGQLLWAVPVDYQKLMVKISCVYIGIDDKTYTHTDSFDSSTDKGTYVDSKGNQLICNTVFENPVKSITSLQIGLLLNDSNNSEINILNNYPPSGSTGGGMDIILDTDFPNSTTLYITPVSGFTKLPGLSYLDTSEDVNARWKEIKTIGLTTLDNNQQGVVVDMTGITSGNYPFKLGATFDHLR